MSGYREQAPTGIIGGQGPTSSEILDFTNDRFRTAQTLNETAIGIQLFLLSLNPTQFTSSSATVTTRPGFFTRNSVSPVEGANLNKSLASSQQMGEVGEAMAGAGTNVAFRDSVRIANTYGGSPGDWAKMRSSSYTSSSTGVNYNFQQFETHWVQNVNTGVRVEFKTKFPRVP